MSDKIKLYCLKSDEVKMEVDPVDAKEILASKDCGVSALSKADREKAKSDGVQKAPKDMKVPDLKAKLDEMEVSYEAGDKKDDLVALLDEALKGLEE